MKKWAISMVTLAIAIFATATIARTTPYSDARLSPMVVKSCADKTKQMRMSASQTPRPAPRATSQPSLMSAPSGGTVHQSKALNAPPPPTPMAEAPKMAQAKSTGGGTDIHQAGKKVERDVAKASQIYLSNDDSMSLASAQRVFYVIDNFLTLYRSQVRPHELLNYYHFNTLPVSGDKPFSVQPELASNDKGTTLSFAVQGRTLTKANRKNAVITFIVDRSGSMGEKGKMEYLKKGLTAVTTQLKAGDVVNMTWFDNVVCTPLESYVVGRDNRSAYSNTLKGLAPRGSTDLHSSLVEGYKLAEKYYDPSKINRVIVITDAIANTGELSPELMASIGKYYDTQQIALSGIGVGQDFNDDLLNEITEKGRGAYLFLGSTDVIARVFGSDFLSLLDTIARDVHFRVTLPKSLKMDVFYGEEVSTNKSKVQPINYFANTSQLFLMDLKGKPEASDALAFDITYKDPTGDAEKTQSEKWAMADVMKGSTANINKARVIMTFADILEKTANSEAPPCRYFCFNSFTKPTDAKVLAEHKKICTDGLEKMKKLASGTTADKEVKEVQDRANKYCSRF